MTKKLKQELREKADALSKLYRSQNDLAQEMRRCRGDLNLAIRSDMGELSDRREHEHGFRELVSLYDQYVRHFAAVAAFRKGQPIAAKRDRRVDELIREIERLIAEYDASASQVEALEAELKAWVEKSGPPRDSELEAAYDSMIAAAKEAVAAFVEDEEEAEHFARTCHVCTAIHLRISAWRGGSHKPDGAVRCLLDELDTPIPTLTHKA